MATELNFVDAQTLRDDLSNLDVLAVVGPPEQLRAAALRQWLSAGLDDAQLDGIVGPMIEHVAERDPANGASTSSWLGEGRRLVICALPTQCSRHNSPSRADAVTTLLKSVSGKRIGVLAALASAEHVVATASAVARCFPLYDRKSSDGEDKESPRASVGFLTDDGAPPLERARAIADGVRLASRIVDTPPDDMTTTAFAELACAVAEKVGAKVTVIRGEDLKSRGFGGIYNVGRAATHEPALVVLEHAPADAEQTVCWVGKGVVYDTGGLSLKIRGGMVGMKSDLGGAAAVLGAFQAAATLGSRHHLYAVLCLAENAIGARAVRPDDIITLYSGRTVEINNTDAEGRLCLGDGVAYCSKHLSPDVIVDAATLTGAQLISTGNRLASTVCNDDALEARAIEAGRRSGDLVHPLPYAPEFFRAEFASKIADMKNSVKDRMNAQTSCAGQFVAEHLDPKWDGAWLHIDLAGPSWRDERGTGFGVALLVETFESGAAG